MSLVILARPFAVCRLLCLVLLAGRGAPFAQSGARQLRPVEVEVSANHLDVFDRPDDKAFITGRVVRGDHLRVCLDQVAGTGWLAIKPLPTSILWIEESSLELEDEAGAETARPDSPSGKHDGDRASRAWVRRDHAVVRSGHLQARLPGPQKGTLPAGTMVLLVDRPVLELGRESNRKRWVAIVPPPDQAFFIHADGIRWPDPSPRVAGPAEVLASFEEPAPTQDVDTRAGKKSPGPLSKPLSRAFRGTGSAGRNVPGNRRQPARCTLAFRFRSRWLPEPTPPGRRSCGPR